MEFKKEALFFDKIAVDMLGWHMRNITIWPEPEMNDIKKAKELEWLIEKGVIFEPPTYEQYPSPLAKEAYNEHEAIMEEYYEINNRYFKTHGSDDTNWLKPSKSLKSHIEKACNIYRKAADPWIRLRALELKKYEDMLAYPILYSTDSYLGKAATKGQILQIILNKLPVPSPETEWRSILDYKEDPETKIRRSGLWTWVA